jgi:hypothetical protein
MFLFLVAGIPAFVWLLAYLFFNDGIEMRLLLKHAAFGALSCMGIIPVFKILVGFFPATFDLLGLYLLHLLGDIVFPALLSFFAYVLVFKPGRNSAPDFHIETSFGFYAGVYSIFALYTFIENARHLDSYHLFILPFVWTMVLMILAHFTGYLVVYEKLTRLALAAILLLAFVFVSGIPLLFMSNFVLLSWFAVAGACAGTWIGLTRGLDILRRLLRLV